MAGPEPRARPRATASAAQVGRIMWRFPQSSSPAGCRMPHRSRAPVRGQPNQCHDAGLLLCRVGRLLRLRRIHHREYAMTGIVAAADVVEFWRQAGAEKGLRGGPEFDALCRERPLRTHRAARRAELAGWEREATGALRAV